MKKHVPPIWKDDVDDKDYDAAYNYLSLRYDDKTAREMVEKLRAAEIVERRANDVLRAFRLPALDDSDPAVVKDIVKIKRDKELSPVLLVSFPTGGDVADGYHRVCACYQLDPDTIVKAKVING